MAQDTKVYLPKQKSRRGVAGYRGKNVVVIDPATGNEDKKATAAANKAAKSRSDDE